ncbi:glycosyltransferase family 1 protein [Sphingobium sp. HT1-2]|uniref:glycosyltransferase family 4 protein n=1 Tax=Sphingobium TaxID=165695 RepID=UPI002FDD6C0C
MSTTRFHYPQFLRTARRRIRRFQDKLAKKRFYRGGWRSYVDDLRRTRGDHPASGRIYVDLTVISDNDAATGIQRVVRAVSFLMARTAELDGMDLHFVYTHRDRHFHVDVGADGYRRTDKPVIYQPGDLFFALDYALDALWQMRHRLADMRRMGVRFWYLVHDFLPLTDPQWFSEPTVIRFYNWLAIIAGTADGIFCVSPVVERQLHVIMATQFGRAEPIPSYVIPMGADIAASRPSRGIPEGFDELLAAMRARPTILMVGTIEPRKGYQDALDAMEYLWADGQDIGLVLVGGTGWKMEAFDARLATHAEKGRRLHQPGKISDEALERVYAACTAVLFPSYAEGFGLPMAEALRFGKPVLARDLPVFEGRGNAVRFFDAQADTPTLACAIRSWLTDVAAGGNQVPASPAQPLYGWQDTADAILSRLSRQDGAVR